MRNWIGTLNNPEVDAREYLEKWSQLKSVKYVCGQLEKGAEGTRHIQYFVNLVEPQRMSYLKKHCGKSHYEPVKINNGAHTYCMKEDTRLEGPWEFGTKPVQRNNKVDWEEQREFAKKGQLDKIDPKLYITHYQNLRAIAKDHQ